MRTLADMMLTQLMGVPRRVIDMHKVYGSMEGKTCGTCKHLTYHERRNRYYKCNKFRFSFGAATDWHKKWPACGLWEDAQENA